MSSSLESQRRSRILDALPAIAWSADAETFRFTYVNPAAETMLGYSVDRWIEEPDFWVEHIHPDDRYVALFCHNETLAARDHELVYRIIAADGRIVWLRDYVNVHCVDGKPLELFGVMVDITREREAEAANRESQENFRRMVELSPDCIGVNVDDTYVYVNQAFVQLLGATSEADIVGQNVFSFLDPTSREHVRARLARLRAGESVPYVREVYIRADGSPLDVEVAALLLRYGNRDAIQVIARDVTDKVRGRKALEESEERYRELVENVAEILYTVDHDGRFLSLNRSFERSTGYDAGEWLGRSFTELFTPDSVPAAIEHFQQALSGEERIIHAYNLLSRSGSIVTVEVSWQPRYVDGIIVGTIGMARDVTEQRNVARKLEESKRMSSLGQVAASLAHEFNNVLMGIQPFVEVIGRAGSQSPPVRDALAHITRAVGRGKRASQEILRFANPKDPQLFAIDISQWLPTLLGQLVAALPSSISLSSAVEAAVQSVRGDREHLEQVITNLVFNARDAIAGAGTIHIDVALTSFSTPIDDEGEFIRISVIDDGPGIPPEVLDHIFEPLFTTKRNGTGLGLAIASRLMERQGGTLTAENRPEGGSAFRLFVPAAAAETASLPLIARVAPGVTRILLVEDDPSVGAGLEELLNSSGFEATWVRMAADACAAARRTRPHVAIIDINLPDGNGVDLVPLLRAEQKDLPIVLSTGHIDLVQSPGTERILSLMKPYQLNELLAAIGTVTAVAA
ncbi:MAG: two-component system, cell cycle sensor histidine kinase and response regulator CckA [Thermoanaerobaculia bacterium]|jgi:PAS domain S-box-containing protein|nr:two-component system, cell cycle sensor histidine kinase and response regulator CckA [Thermoanaerobaculia bacterium]